MHYFSSYVYETCCMSLRKLSLRAVQVSWKSQHCKREIDGYYLRIYKNSAPLSLLAYARVCSGLSNWIIKEISAGPHSENHFTFRCSPLLRPCCSSSRAAAAAGVGRQMTTTSPWSP